MEISRNLQTIQNAGELLNEVLAILGKVVLSDPLERVQGQQAIRSGLVGLPDNPTHIQGLADPVQPTI